MQLCMSTAYNPQSDDHTERVNQCMETYLRCFVAVCPKKWLPLAEFWYNTSFHSALGRSPFEALYGHSPRHMGIPSVNVSSASDMDQWLQERQVMIELVKQHLNRACVRMKLQADKGRSERQFQVGDLVFLRL
jgi:hypothetical protein